MNTIVITSGAKQSPCHPREGGDPEKFEKLDSRLRGNDNRASDGIRLLRQGNALPRNDDRIIEGNVIASEAKQSPANKDKIATPISWARIDVPIHNKHPNLRTQA